MPRNLFEYHPRLGYRFIPGIRARVRHENGGYMVSCNASGFRCDHDLTPQKPRGSFRVLLFGDSYTAGDGVSNRQRYGDLIESYFEDMQLLNFGLPGSGTDQQYLVFEEYANDLEYDLMMVCPLVENIVRNNSVYRVTANTTDGLLVRRAKPYFELNDNQLKLCNVPVPKDVKPVEDDTRSPNGTNGCPTNMQRAARMVYQRYPKFHCFMQRVRNIRYPKEYENTDDPGWQLMKAILIRWAKRAKSDVLICPLPTFAHVNRCLRSDGYRQRFAELNHLGNVRYVDILPQFWQLDSRDRQRCRFPFDDHPSPFGHQVIADALIGHVRQYYDSWKESNA